MIKLSRGCREVSVVDRGGEDRCGGWKLPVTAQNFNHQDVAVVDDDHLKQRGGGVDEGDPGVGVPAGLPPPTSICSCTSCSAQASCLLRDRKYMICEAGLVLMMAMTTMMRLTSFAWW